MMEDDLIPHVFSRLGWDWPIRYRVERRSGHIRIVLDHNGQGAALNKDATFVRGEDFDSLRESFRQRRESDGRVIDNLNWFLCTLRREQAEEKRRAVTMLAAILRQIGERAVLEDLTADRW